MTRRSSMLAAFFGSRAASHFAQRSASPQRNAALLWLTSYFLGFHGRKPPASGSLPRLECVHGGTGASDVVHLAEDGDGPSVKAEHAPPRLALGVLELQRFEHGAEVGAAGGPRSL